jgi:hypothetical protein
MVYDTESISFDFDWELRGVLLNRNTKLKSKNALTDDLNLTDMDLEDRGCRTRFWTTLI